MEYRPHLKFFVSNIFLSTILSLCNLHWFFSLLGWHRDWPEGIVFNLFPLTLLFLGSTKIPCQFFKCGLNPQDFQCLQIHFEFFSYQKVKLCRPNWRFTTVLFMHYWHILLLQNFIKWKTYKWCIPLSIRRTFFFTSIVLPL